MFWDPEPTPMTTSKRGTGSGAGVTWFIKSQVPESNRECHRKLRGTVLAPRLISRIRAKRGGDGPSPLRKATILIPSGDKLSPPQPTLALAPGALLCPLDQPQQCAVVKRDQVHATPIAYEAVATRRGALRSADSVSRSTSAVQLARTHSDAPTLVLPNA